MYKRFEIMNILFFSQETLVEIRNYEFVVGKICIDVPIW